MPAQAPRITPSAARQLQSLGAALAQRRKQQKVTALAAAEAAGISRVTLHRIEKGEPAVAIAAWAAVADALGTSLDLAQEAAAGAAFQIPARVRIAEYPQLEKLAWQLHGVSELSPLEALQLYERNWRHVDKMALGAGELQLIRALADQFGAGALLV